MSALTVAGRVVLIRLGVDSLALHLGVGVIAGLIGPLGLVWLAQRVGVSAYVGFDPPKFVQPTTPSLPRKACP